MSNMILLKRLDNEADSLEEDIYIKARISILSLWQPWNGLPFKSESAVNYIDKAAITVQV